MNRRGFTLIELLLVVAIVGIILSISMVIYRHARILGGEAVAVATLNTINQAQFAFMQTCGNQRYAPTFVSLGTKPPNGDPYLSPDLTASDPLQKSGYLYEMKGSPDPDVVLTCTGVSGMTGYTVTADPVIPGNSGDHYYGTNTERVVYEDVDTFTGSMPETGPPRHGTEIK